MTALSTVSYCLDEAQSSDNTLLNKIFASINKRFFKNSINVELIWEVPKGTVSISIGKKGLILSPDNPLFGSFQKARQLLQKNQTDIAIPLLIECADANHSDSLLLLSHIFKRTKDTRWQHYATAYNQQLSTFRAVPAACYYPDNQTIAIHPHLRDKPCPQFVLKYLIFHECCHQKIECDENNPHPDAFMEWEHKAPNRARALEWLEKQGFPTLRTAHGC